MHPALYLLILAGWLAWFLPFLRANRSGIAERIDPRARWGVVLQALSYVLLWQGSFWEHQPAAWKIALATILFLTATVLSSTSVRTLGRQWRVDAGLNRDHALVRSGPYAIMRHPIYTSMLCMLLATGLLVARWPLFLVALLVFLAGAGIRMRVENQLLAARFGVDFTEYKRLVPACIPGLRLFAKR
jgi:protein-S-isoprenylcysteine O-methyltransferase Ste14